MNINPKIIILILLAILLFFVSSAHAAPVDPGDYNSMVEGFQVFFNNAQNAVADVINYNQYQDFVFILYSFFALLLIVFTFSKYITAGVDYTEILSLVILLLMVNLLMTEYDVLTRALWNWSQGFAGAIQQAALGSDQLYAPMSFIWRVMSGIEFEGWNLLLSPLKWIATFVAMLVALVLTLLSVYATVWGLWGYLVAKMIGLMFVPTILFDKLSFLFDGWLRFFLGFLLYSVIARVNLTLVVLSISSLYGIPPLNPGVSTIHIGGALLFELGGLLAFLLVGVLALMSTGRFVSSVVGGANMGMGGAMAGVALGLSRSIMRGK